MNCYATLHAGKGRNFYSRLCHLDGIKAKDGQRNYSSGSAYQRLRALIVGQGRRRTRNRVLRARKFVIVLNAGARRGAKSEPLAFFVRTPQEEIFVGLADMVRPQGREGGGSETTDADPDAANAQLYDDTVRKVFDQLGIEWKVIEERIIAVVSDGAGTMGAYVGLAKAIREKGREELIAWVKDAAHCLMRAISTAKGKVKLWYDALGDLVSFLACFYRTSSKRMRGLWRKGGKFCFSRRTGVRWVEAMFHELDIVLENLPAILEHLPEYINHEADLGWREKAQGLFDALSHPLFKFTAAGGAGGHRGAAPGTRHGVCVCVRARACVRPSVCACVRACVCVRRVVRASAPTRPLSKQCRHSAADSAAQWPAGCEQCPWGAAPCRAYGLQGVQRRRGHPEDLLGP